MFDWVFGNRRAGAAKEKRGKPPNYEDARAIADKGTVAERCDLAANEFAQPEILYYFATDDAPDVRRATAKNEGTPLQADLVLARDTDVEVRGELARKIGRLVPTLTDEESARLTDIALEVLNVLAGDHEPRVRAIISEELKRADNVPRDLIRKLAEDLEDIVAAPVLEYSPLLRDEDLIEIIGRGLKGRHLIAVSRRRSLPEPVSDAVVDTGDIPAMAALLENATATIGARALDRIIDAAEHDEKWHNAMVYRDDLPVRTVLRIASFVSAALMEALIERNKDNAGLVEDLRKTVRDRIEKGEFAGGAAPKDSAETRAQKAFKSNKLDEAAIQTAMDGDDIAFVRYGLGLLADMPIDTVNTMLNSGSGKAVVALAWKAGLSMDTAMKIQDRIARVRADARIEADSQGGYPLSAEDLEWYVESFFV